MSDNQSEDRLEKALEKYVELKIQIEAELEEKYPSNVPNKVCKHAIISGIKIENSAGLTVKGYIPLMEIGYEKVFIWTHSEDQYSSVVSEVSPDVLDLNYWKNFGYLLKLASAFYSFFESICETNYHWIYYFDNNNGIKDSEFLERDPYEQTINSVLKLSFFKEISSLLELLQRDNKFYTALSIFLNSIESHWFCFHCELSKSGHKKHPSHEPQKWEEAELIPKMESALVQCCRSVEAILGKPGNRDDQSKVLRAKERWRSVIKLEPNDIFEREGVSFYDYYYKLFDLRNNSAHSYGELPFNVSRQITINAQCFAFIVITSYLEANTLEIEDAGHKLKLNSELISREHPEITTIKTAR